MNHLEQMTDQTLEYESMAHEPWMAFEAAYPDALLDRLDPSELPVGYGFTGGAARAVALYTLFGEEASIRDIDVEAFTDCGADLSLAGSVSAQYMPDDYAFGHGAEGVRLAEYFESRDFTVNEVAVVGGMVLLTAKAYADLRDKRICLSDYEASGNNPKLAMKSLLFETVFESEFGTCTNDCGAYGVPAFFVALGLNKAYQYSDRIASGFVKKLVTYGLADEWTTPHELARNLQQETDFVFRGFAGAAALRPVDVVASSDCEDGLGAEQEPEVQPLPRVVKGGRYITVDDYDK